MIDKLYLFDKNNKISALFFAHNEVVQALPFVCESRVYFIAVKLKDLHPIFDLIEHLSLSLTNLHNGIDLLVHAYPFFRRHLHSLRCGMLVHEFNLLSLFGLSY
jgi:hypothetical protein